MECNKSSTVTEKTFNEMQQTKGSPGEHCTACDYDNTQFKDSRNMQHCRRLSDCGNTSCRCGRSPYITALTNSSTDIKQSNGGLRNCMADKDKQKLYLQHLTEVSEEEVTLSVIETSLEHYKNLKYVMQQLENEEELKSDMNNLNTIHNTFHNFAGSGMYVDQVKQFLERQKQVKDEINNLEQSKNIIKTCVIFDDEVSSVVYLDRIKTLLENENQLIEDQCDLKEIKIMLQRFDKSDIVDDSTIIARLKELLEKERALENEIINLDNIKSLDDTRQCDVIDNQTCKDCLSKRIVDKEELTRKTYDLKDIKAYLQDCVKYFVGDNKDSCNLECITQLLEKETQLEKDVRNLDNIKKTLETFVSPNTLCGRHSIYLDYINNLLEKEAELNEKLDDLDIIRKSLQQCGKHAVGQELSDFERVLQLLQKEDQLKQDMLNLEHAKISLQKSIDLESTLDSMIYMEDINQLLDEEERINQELYNLNKCKFSFAHRINSYNSNSKLDLENTSKYGSTMCQKGEHHKKIDSLNDTNKAVSGCGYNQLLHNERKLNKEVQELENIQHSLFKYITSETYQQNAEINSVTCTTGDTNDGIMYFQNNIEPMRSSSPIELVKYLDEAQETQETNRSESCQEYQYSNELISKNNNLENVETCSQVPPNVVSNDEDREYLDRLKQRLDEEKEFENDFLGLSNMNNILQKSTAYYDESIHPKKKLQERNNRVKKGKQFLQTCQNVKSDGRAKYNQPKDKSDKNILKKCTCTDAKYLLSEKHLLEKEQQCEMQVCELNKIKPLFQGYEHICINADDVGYASYMKLTEQLQQMDANFSEIMYPLSPVDDSLKISMDLDTIYLERVDQLLKKGKQAQSDVRKLLHTGEALTKSILQYADATAGSKTNNRCKERKDVSFTNSKYSTQVENSTISLVHLDEEVQVGQDVSDLNTTENILQEATTKYNTKEISNIKLQQINVHVKDKQFNHQQKQANTDGSRIPQEQIRVLSQQVAEVHSYEKCTWSGDASTMNFLYAEQLLDKEKQLDEEIHNLRNIKTSFEEYRKASAIDTDIDDTCYMHLTNRLLEMEIQFSREIKYLRRYENFLKRYTNTIGLNGKDAHYCDRFGHLLKKEKQLQCELKMLVQIEKSFQRHFHQNSGHADDRYKERLNRLQQILDQDASCINCSICKQSAHYEDKNHILVSTQSLEKETHVSNFKVEQASKIEQPAKIEQATKIEQAIEPAVNNGQEHSRAEINRNYLCTTQSDTLPVVEFFVDSSSKHDNRPLVCSCDEGLATNSYFKPDEDLHHKEDRGILTEVITVAKDDLRDGPPEKCSKISQPENFSKPQQVIPEQEEIKTCQEHAQANKVHHWKCLLEAQSASFTDELVNLLNYLRNACKSDQVTPSHMICREDVFLQNNVKEAIQKENTTQNTTDMLHKLNTEIEYTYGITNNLDLRLINSNLSEEQELLTDKLDDLQMEQEHANQRIEGPMARELDRLRRQSMELQKEFNTSKRFEEAFTKTTELELLRNHITITHKNISDFTFVNNGLKREIVVLNHMCFKMEEILVHQKRNEIHTINKFK